MTGFDIVIVIAIILFTRLGYAWFPNIFKLKKRGKTNTRRMINFLS
jgi:hypothetical protein